MCQSACRNDDLHMTVIARCVHLVDLFDYSILVRQYEFHCAADH